MLSMEKPPITFGSGGADILKYRISTEILAGVEVAGCVNDPYLE